MILRRSPEYQIISKVENDELESIKNWYLKISDEKKNDLQFDFGNDSFFKMEIESVIIGLMSIAEHRYWYGDMKRFIVEEHRGKDLGEKFLDYLVMRAETKKIHMITANLKSENKKGQLFLRSKGFKIIELITQFKNYSP